MSKYKSLTRMRVHNFSPCGLLRLKGLLVLAARGELEQNKCRNIANYLFLVQLVVEIFHRKSEHANFIAN